MKTCVVEVNNKLYVVRVKNFIPENYIADLPDGIDSIDYPYLKKEGSPGNYIISVDQDAIDTDPNYGVFQF